MTFSSSSDASRSRAAFSFATMALSSLRNVLAWSRKRPKDSDILSRVALSSFSSSPSRLRKTERIRFIRSSLVLSLSIPFLAFETFPGSEGTWAAPGVGRMVMASTAANPTNQILRMTPYLLLRRLHTRSVYESVDRIIAS